MHDGHASLYTIEAGKIRKETAEMWISRHKRQRHKDMVQQDRIAAKSNRNRENFFFWFILLLLRQVGR